MIGLASFVYLVKTEWVPAVAAPVEAAIPDPTTGLEMDAVTPELAENDRVLT